MEDSLLLQKIDVVHPPLIHRREECSYLLAVLNRVSNARQVAIIGPTGMGKTSLILDTISFIHNSSLPQRLKELTFYRFDLKKAIDSTAIENAFSMPVSRQSVVIFSGLETLFSHQNSDKKSEMREHILRYIGQSESACLCTINSDAVPREKITEFIKRYGFEHFQPPPLSTPDIRRILSGKRLYLQNQFGIEIPPRIIDEIIEMGRSIQFPIAFPKAGIELLEATIAAAEIRIMQSETPSKTVHITDLYKQLSHSLRIPIGTYSGIETNRILQLKGMLQSKIIGQNTALHAVARAVQHALLGTREPFSTQPLGVLLFMGPTGVGKTETAKELSRCLFGHQRAILLNMAEFQDPIESVRRLKSSALASPLKDNPFTVVILDEIEKSSPRVREFFLSIFDQGMFKDDYDRILRVDKTFFVLTSNVGSELFDKTHGLLPDSFSDQDYALKKNELIEALKKHGFKPEFINRIDDILVFKPLNYHDIEEIIQINLATYAQYIAEKDNKKVVFDPGLVRMLADSCDLNFGARDSKRLLRRHIFSRILRTDEFYRAKTLSIERSHLLKQRERITLLCYSLQEKDGIQLILDLNKDKFPINAYRVTSIAELKQIIEQVQIDLLLLHSSLAVKDSLPTPLNNVLQYLKKIDHHAQLFLVVDALQSFSQFKDYLSFGVKGLLRVNELEEWLQGMVGEIAQRKKLSARLRIDEPSLCWKKVFVENGQLLRFILDFRS